MRTLLTARRVILCTAVLALAGCGDSDTPTGGDPAPTTEPATTVPAGSEPIETTERPDDGTPSSGTVPPPVGPVDEIIVEPGTDGAVITGAAPQHIVDGLIERVSAETGIDPSDITVVTSFAKTWTNGSLGCAEPGIVYTEQEQAGYQVELATADESWDFRVRENGDVIVCADTLAQPSPPITPTDITAPERFQSIVDIAIADLREHLGDPGADIGLVSVDEMTWPDGSIGCPRAGMSYTQALVEGSLIVLEHDGRRYPYHQAGVNDPFLCILEIPTDK